MSDNAFRILLLLAKKQCTQKCCDVVAIGHYTKRKADRNHNRLMVSKCNELNMVLIWDGFTPNNHKIIIIIKKNSMHKKKPTTRYYTTISSSSLSPPPSTKQRWEHCDVYCAVKLNNNNIVVLFRIYIFLKDYPCKNPFSSYKTNKEMALDSVCTCNWFWCFTAKDYF